MKSSADPAATTRAIPGISGQYKNTPRVTVLVDDGLITVTAIGRLDRPTAATFRDDLLEVWPVCAGILVVDLSACSFLGIAAVHALQEVWRQPERLRGELRVIADHPDVIAALDNAGIPRFWDRADLVASTPGRPRQRHRQSSVVASSASSSAHLGAAGSQRFN